MRHRTFDVGGGLEFKRQSEQLGLMPGLFQGTEQALHVVVCTTMEKWRHGGRNQYLHAGSGADNMGLNASNAKSCGPQRCPFTRWVKGSPPGTWASDG